MNGPPTPSNACTRRSSANKPQTVLPSAETAAMLFWALMASCQITKRKVDGWQTLGEMLADLVPVDLAA